MNALGTRHVIALDRGRFLSLSAEAYLVYEARRRGDDIGVIATALSRHCGRLFSEDDVEHAIALIAANVERAAVQKRGDVRLLRIELLPAVWVNAIAQRLMWSFNPVIAWCVCIITGGAIMTSFATNGFHGFPARTWIGAYALFLVTIVAHEFGHATACRSAGERAGPIGFTAFFMFPALYTDVSKAWLLRRGHRIAIDVGGVYFQLPYVAAFAAGASVTHSAVLFLAEAFVLSGIALNLNPVLRFDGYWLLADALDLPNLAHEPLRMLRALVRREVVLPGRARWQAVTVACYGVLNAAAWAYAAAFSASILFRRPADISAALRSASTNLTTGLVMHLGLLLTSMVLLAYGLTTLTRSATAVLRQFLNGVKHDHA